MKKFKRNSLKRFLIIYIPIHILIYYVVLNFYHNPVAQIFAGILSLMGPLISASLLYLLIRRMNEGERLFWRLILFGMVSYILAELFLDFFILKTNTEPTFPYISDYLFLLQPMIFLTAFIFLVAHDLRKTKMAITIVDILIIVIVITSFSWYLLIGPIFQNRDATIPELTVLVSYPLLDLLILFGIVHARYFLKQSKSTKIALNIFLISMVISFICNSVYLYLVANGDYETGNILDPLWTMSMFYIGLATLYVDHHSKTESAYVRKKDLTQSHFLPIASIVLLTIIYGIYDAGIDELFIGLVFSFFLLFARQFIMLKENKQLNGLLQHAKQQLEEKNQQLEETILELERLNEIRSIEARTDFLTGIYNRRYIDSVVHTLIKEANAENQPFSLLLIDIDYFKSVNDRFGHDVGDRVIQKAAQIFRESIRTSDLLGRFGGEEFIILLPHSNLQAGIRLAKRIQKKVQDYTINIDHTSIHITVSIGVTVWEPNDQFNTLYKRVDEALYEAKKKRNTVVIKTKQQSF